MIKWMLKINVLYYKKSILVMILLRFNWLNYYFKKMNILKLLNNSRRFWMKNQIIMEFWPVSLIFSEDKTFLTRLKYLSQKPRDMQQIIMIQVSVIVVVYLRNSIEILKMVKKILYKFIYFKKSFNWIQQS